MPAVASAISALPPSCIRTPSRDTTTSPDPARGDTAMPQGDKDKYTDKQKRKAEHIEKSYERKGVSGKEAEARAWATVNKQSGGGNRSGGSGQKKSSQAKSADRSDPPERIALGIPG